MFLTYMFLKKYILLKKYFRLWKELFFYIQNNWIVIENNYYMATGKYPPNSIVIWYNDI